MLNYCTLVDARARSSLPTTALAPAAVYAMCGNVRQLTGFSGFFDYGPLGVEMKNNIKKIWWRDMVHRRDDMVRVHVLKCQTPQCT